MPGRTQMVDQRLHTFNWISLAAGHGFLRALAERISLQQALRHRFARCWYQPRVGTATPASAALLLAQLPCPAMPHVCLLFPAKLVHFEPQQKIWGRGA